MGEVIAQLGVASVRVQRETVLAVVRATEQSCGLDRRVVITCGPDLRRGESESESESIESMSHEIVTVISLTSGFLCFHQPQALPTASVQY